MKNISRIIKNARLKNVIKSFIPFQVFYLSCTFITRPRSKYLLLICDNPLLFFFINSKVNINFERNPDMFHSQIPIYPEEAPFLSKLSYINCKQEISNFTLDNVVEQIMRNESIVKGTIDTSVQKKVIEAVNDTKATRLIAPRFRKKILKFIRK